MSAVQLVSFFLSHLETNLIADDLISNIHLGDTNCFAPSGGGPNPYDCRVIENALKYESANDGKRTRFFFGGGKIHKCFVGDQFPIRAANSTGAVTMTYATCKTFIDNLVGGDLTYCRNDWVILENQYLFMMS